MKLLAQIAAANLGNYVAGVIERTFARILVYLIAFIVVAVPCYYGWHGHGVPIAVLAEWPPLAALTYVLTLIGWRAR